MAHTWADLGGGNFSNPELSKTARMAAAHQMRLMELVDPAGDFALGKKSGDSVAFKMYGRIAADATTSLGETTKFTIGKVPEYTGLITVYRYGYGVGWTGVREDLDRLDIQSPVVKALKNHAARTDDTLIRSALVAGRSFRYKALTASTYIHTADGTTPAGTIASSLNKYHLDKMSYLADVYNMPLFDGSNYLLATSTRTYHDLYQDTVDQGFIDVMKYSNSGVEDLLSGEVGKYGRFRIIKDNYALQNGTTYGEAFLVGSEAVKESVVNPMQLLSNMNLGGGFGEEKAIAWTFFKGYQTPWIYSSTGNNQGTVLHYESN